MNIELSDKLPAPAVAFLHVIGEIAAEHQTRVYLVGGLVRDLLLDLHDFAPDIDILLEGDAPTFVKFVKREWGKYFGDLPEPAKLVIFPRYGTAKLSFTESVGADFDVIDFASAREESYSESGKPPEIRLGNLESDLRRRDFTINGMALGLLPTEFGKLYDFNNGLEHLSSRELVVFHEQSFFDDPARMLRGVRLIVRLDLKFAADTEALFQKAVSDNYLARLPRARLYDEFLKALDDRPAADIVQALESAGMLGQIHPYFSKLDNPVQRIRELEKPGAKLEEIITQHKSVRRGQLLFSALCYDYDEAEYDPLLREFQVPRKKRDEMQKLKKLVSSIYED